MCKIFGLLNYSFIPTSKTKNDTRKVQMQGLKVRNY